MKDIPLFTGRHGIGSLVLKEIPVSGRAYVLVRGIWNGETEAFLQECVGFCRSAGAETVYASYETAELPGIHAYDMLSMELEKANLPRPTETVELESLTRKNGQAYLEIYNRCFRDVAGAASYGKQDLERLYDKGCAFLAKVDGTYAAVAEISEQGLEGIAVLPLYRGLGYELALTVLPMVPRKTIRLKTASTNENALALYRRLGFDSVEVVSRWWRIPWENTLQP